MESGVIGLVRRKKGDNDADGAEQIAKHCDDLVIGNILGVEFGSVVKRVCACRRSLCGIEAVAAGGTENNVVLALCAAFGTEFHKLATSHSKFSYTKYIMYIHRSQYISRLRVKFCANIRQYPHPLRTPRGIRHRDSRQMSLPCRIPLTHNIRHPLGICSHPM